MHLISGLAVNHVIIYLAIFFITFLSPTNANAIPPWALDSTGESLGDNEAITAANLNQLDLRNVFQNSIIEGVPVLEDRSLIKRGGCVSRRGGKQQVEYVCSPEPPSVDECADKIRAWGKVKEGTSFFYTAFPAAVGGYESCKQYFACHPEDRPVVSWDEIVDNGWYMAQGRAIVASASDPQGVTDQFQKRLAQAFGQEANGVAYICTPEGKSPDDNFPAFSAWGGWEYPALTRNPSITKIMRVDPTTGVVRQIWAQGQPPTANEPRG